MITLKDPSKSQFWPWWFLLPLYPYSRRKTIFKELIPNKVWSLEQLQGIYYVAVPVRLTIVKVPEGLMLLNPLPPTQELVDYINKLEKDHGPVKTIVLPTASGLEHKISLPALARAFPKSQLWVCPGQWSFPVSLPLSWLGLSKKRTRILFADGLPHKETCDWISLGPLDIGLGRFQEISCFHRPSKALLVTDALIAIDSNPPELFDFDPTPLLFHSREKGSEKLIDTLAMRKKGWARIVLFASFLKPENLVIPSLSSVIANSFKPGLRNLKSHFGIYPFDWSNEWIKDSNKLVGNKKPILQIPPVIERLVFPRAKEAFAEWLDDLACLNQMKWLIPSHFNPMVPFTSGDAKSLKMKIMKRVWGPSKGSWQFLDWLDTTLLKNKVVPKDPLQGFRS